MSERPVVHCLIAWPKGDRGDIRRVQRVPLSTADIAHKAGLYVVGPDPEDVEALAQWLRDQVPFNQPRLE